MAPYSLIACAFLAAAVALACRDAAAVVQGRWVSSVEEEDDAEIEEQLRRLNKPAVKTIQSAINGELFDCVGIYEQPAFDHPLLKGHKLQLPKSSSGDGGSRWGAIELGYNDTCPAGTVLIRRTTKEQLIASKIRPCSFSGSNGSRDNAAGDKIIDLANYLAVLSATKGYMSGFQADLTTWEIPSVSKGQFSASLVAVVGVPDRTGNGVQSGWHVHPAMYGDNRPRFFTLWTSDDFETTGCYNTLCPGFVHISGRFAPGSIVPRISRSPSAEEHINIYIYRGVGGWWIQMDGIKIGYWPKELFNNFAVSKMISFGGITFSKSPNLKSPPMGNGNFPGGGSAYLKNLQLVDNLGYFYAPKNDDLEVDITSPDHYSIWKDSPSDDNFNVPFGGPGGA